VPTPARDACVHAIAVLGVDPDTAEIGQFLMQLRRPQGLPEVNTYRTLERAVVASPHLVERAGRRQENGRMRWRLTEAGRARAAAHNYGGEVADHGR
jgi:hypothetical protein